MIGSKIESTIVSMNELFLLLLVPTINSKPSSPSFYRLWSILHCVKWQIAVTYFTMFLICLNHYSAVYDCSLAKKRRAEEQALGVPVNKRKSLLMKPRHYSPNTGCKEEHDASVEAEEDGGVLENSDHSITGSKKQHPKCYLLPGTKTQPSLM